VLKGTEYLTTKLADDLALFSSFDRVSLEGIDWIRAAYKEFHGGGEYAKGKGREFVAWLKEHHPAEFFMPFENAHGTRQDISFDGLVPIFANRKLMAEFLNQLVNAPGTGDNRLEKSFWRVLKCNEMTALARVSTLFKYVISDPMRWLTGKASKELQGWSLASSSEMWDQLEKALTSIAADGHALLDPHLDPFDSFEKTQPLFAKHMAELRTHPMHARVLAEARSPSGKGNAQATEVVVELAERMANAGLAAMHDSRRGSHCRQADKSGWCQRCRQTRRGARAHQGIAPDERPRRVQLWLLRLGRPYVPLHDCRESVGHSSADAQSGIICSNQCSHQ
jgi:hypothetical protein